MTWRTALAVLLLSAAVSNTALAAGLQPEPMKTTEIASFGVAPLQTRFGEFDFAGGLVLRSTDRQFGGLSGLDFEPDQQHFWSVSDNGFWFRARAIRQSGRLVGIGEAEWAPMLNALGVPLGAKRNADAEGLRLTRIDGMPAAYVSFERTNDLRLYRGADLARAKPIIQQLPFSVRGLKSNRGLEAVALSAPNSRFGGSPLLVSERSLDRQGNHRAWVVRGPLMGEFSVARSDDFDVTDAAFLPNGDLLILERRAELPFRVGMRIRRIASASIRPGALVDGRVALLADMSNQIDNMEGLAISRDPDGTTRITLVSDDNLSPLQRTLLLEFVWRGPATNATQ